MSLIRNTSYEVILSPKAEKDLENIYFYISTSFYYQYAKRIRDSIVNKILSLSFMPYRFQKDKHLNGARSVKVENYIVIYDVVEELKEVQIIRIIYSMSNLQTLANENERLH